MDVSQGFSGLSPYRFKDPGDEDEFFFFRFIDLIQPGVIIIVQFVVGWTAREIMRNKIRKVFFLMNDHSTKHSAKLGRNIQ
jgi:hypothetical protein